MKNFDLQEITELLGAEVKICTIDGNCHLGSVYAIDPLSNTVVLYNKVNTEYNMKIITNHSIESFQMLKSSVLTAKLEVKPSLVLAEEELEEKRCKIKQWLKSNLINVEEQGRALKIDDQLIIEPPYGLTDCLCGNTIILDRIRTILNNMPTDI